MKSFDSTHNIDLKLILSAFTLRGSSNGNHINLQLPIKTFKKRDIDNRLAGNQITTILGISPDDVIQSVNEDVDHKKEPILSFKVSSNYFTNEVLFDHNYFENLLSPKSLVDGQKVIIDYR